MIGGWIVMASAAYMRLGGRNLVARFLLSGVMLVVSSLAAAFSVVAWIDRGTAGDNDIAALLNPSDERIVENFIVIAMNAERERRPARTVVKWTKPIRLAAWGEPSEAHRLAIEAHVKLLRYLTGHDIAWDVNGRPNFVILFVRSADEVLDRYRHLPGQFFDDEQEMTETVRSIFATKSCYLVTGLDGGKIIGAVAIIPIGYEAATVYQCIVEEMSQALGLPNDSAKVAYSIFNDHSPYVDLTGQDQLFLRILYDGRMKPGMLETEARRTARVILNDLRGRMSTFCILK